MRIYVGGSDLRGQTRALFMIQGRIMFTRASFVALGGLLGCKKIPKPGLIFFTPWIFQKENVVSECSYLIIKVPMSLSKKKAIFHLMKLLPSQNLIIM